MNTKLNPLTKKLLKLAKEAGYEWVKIRGFASGTSRDILAGPGNSAGLPPLWDIMDDMGISWGCGNGHQHQFNTENCFWGGPQVKNKYKDKRLVSGYYKI